MALALRHGELPRTLHVDAPSREVDWGAGAVELLTDAVPWPPSEPPRRAAVSAFGVSGTNAHLILEEAPAVAARHRQEERPLGEGTLAWVVSAKGEPALRAQAERLHAHLEAHPGLDPADVGYSLAATRARLPHRAVAVGAGRDELMEALAAIAAGRPSANAVTGTATGGKLAFLFPGQGSQWAGMGRELAGAFPVFADALAGACAAFDPHLDPPLLPTLSAAAETAEAGLLGQNPFTPPPLFAPGGGPFWLLWAVS